jgi:hypothetical protein
MLENRLPSLQSWIIITAWIMFFVWLGAIVNAKLQDDVRDVV